MHRSFEVGASPTLAHYCVEKGINKLCDPELRRRIDVQSPGRAKNGMGDIGAWRTGDSTPLGGTCISSFVRVSENYKRATSFSRCGWMRSPGYLTPSARVTNPFLSPSKGLVYPLVKLAREFRSYLVVPLTGFGSSFQCAGRCVFVPSMSKCRQHWFSRSTSWVANASMG